MANEVLSAGVKVGYVIGTAGHTPIPTTGYKEILGITDISGLDDDPDMVEVTDLSDMQFRRYIPGLVDVSGSIQLSANKTEAFMTAWAALLEEYNGRNQETEAMWFCVYFPGASQSFYFIGMPQALGMPDVSVGEKLTITGRVVPNYIASYSTAATFAST